LPFRFDTPAFGLGARILVSRVGDSAFRDLSVLMPGDVWRFEARERGFAVVGISAL
jgi:hypothetical protein